MKTIFNCFILSIFIHFSSTIIQAQDVPYKCVYEPDAQTQEISRQVLAKMNSLKGQSQGNQTSLLTGVVKIPLVVHVIEPSTSSSIITDAEVNAMVANLNASYRATGAFAGSQDIEVEFELAKQDPTCNTTTGITRYDASGNATYVSKGVFNTGVSWATIQSWKVWPKNLYANIWIVHKLDNGAAGVGGPSEGFIVLASSAKTPNEQVSPHEIAHYFGLAHPFPTDATPGTTTNCNCGDGDGLTDTPNLTAYSIGSICSHEWSCSTTAMNSINPCTNAAYGNIQKNIMNYLNNTCGTQFTANQKTFMRNFIESYHSVLLTSPVLQTTPSTPTATITATPTFCTSTAFPNFSATCLCSSIQTMTINGNVVTSYGLKPVLSAGQQSTWTYGLTCANGLTDTKTVLFYNPGVTNIVTACGTGGFYSLAFNNPNNFTVTSSLGTVVGNSVINIPNGTNVILTVSDANGCGNNQQTVISPCCSLGANSPVACTPTATNGLSVYFGIASFAFNGTPAINATSSSSQSDGKNYVDNSCLNQTNVIAGNTYTLTVGGYFTNAHKVKVYIDYNNNGQFTEADETVLSGTTSGSTGGNVYSGTITIPNTAVANTLLRVRVLADPSSSSNSCTIVGQTGFGSGQIEDYALTVTNNCSMYSVKSGNWDDATVWSCARIPTNSDIVTITSGHTVTVPSSVTAHAKDVKAYGVLTLQQTGLLKLVTP